MQQPDMPALRAFKRGELSAQEAIYRARYMDEAEAIIAEARRRTSTARDDADVLEGLGESFTA